MVGTEGEDLGGGSRLAEPAIRQLVDALGTDLPAPFALVHHLETVELRWHSVLEMSDAVDEMDNLDSFRNFLEQIVTCVEERTTDLWPPCAGGALHALVPTVEGEWICWVCNRHGQRVDLGRLGGYRARAKGSRRRAERAL